MTARLTLKAALEKAIQREMGSQLLYNDLARRVNEPAARDAFRELVRQEKGHQTLLEEYLQGVLTEGALGRGQVIDYKIAEHLDQPEVTPDMGLKETFLLAANREKASHEFYIALAEIHPAGKVKNLLEGLASQELAHKNRVELLFTEVAFPQTDGG